MAIITVTTLDDIVANDGEVSLREAIMAANMNISVDGSAVGNNGQDTIVFDVGAEGGTIFLQGGEFTITESIDIEGILGEDGMPIIQISADSSEGAGDADSRIFKLDGTGFVFLGIDSLFLRDGNADSDVDGDGGAINADNNGNNSSTDIRNSVLINNHADGDGGAFWSEEGRFSARNSTFSENTAEDTGGAVFTSSGDIRFSRSTLSENSSQEGGAIATAEGGINGTLSTFHGNEATVYGGGAIQSGSGRVFITDSVFSMNRAAESGGAIYNFADSLELRGSEFSGNVAEHNGGAIYAYHDSVNASATP